MSTKAPHHEIGEWVWVYHGWVFARTATVDRIGSMTVFVVHAPTSDDDPLPWSWFMVPALGGPEFLREWDLPSAKAAKCAATKALRAWAEDN